MNPTLQLIIALLPLADKLIFDLGGKLIELSTQNIKPEDIVKMLEDSKSESWPKLKFLSTKTEANS
jgi:hypothetical protein